MSKRKKKPGKYNCVSVLRFLVALLINKVLAFWLSEGEHYTDERNKGRALNLIIKGFCKQENRPLTKLEYCRK